MPEALFLFKKGPLALAAAGRHLMASWRDLEQGTPHIARTGRALLEQARVALLGMLRRDGSPPDQPRRAVLRRRPADVRRHELVRQGA